VMVQYVSAGLNEIPVKKQPYQASSYEWATLANHCHDIDPTILLRKHIILVRIGSRRPGMIAENICIRPLSSTIAQDNITLRWMSGVLKRNLSNGPEQPTSKSQVSCFYSIAVLNQSD
jgi:hypothetical protein